MNKDEEITHMGWFVNEERVKTFIKRHFYVLYIDFTSHKGMLANQTAHKKWRNCWSLWRVWNIYAKNVR